jgi:uroporphyrinogen III methyltransferase/synthase
MPDEAIGARIAKAFAAFESLDNLKICLLRAEVANRELPLALEEMGAIVDDIACYRTVAETADTSGAAGRLAQSGADWILFTSGSTVENFHTRFNLPALVARFPKLSLASIGPETSKALAGLGVKPAIEAREHTVDGLLAALTNEVAKK